MFFFSILKFYLIFFIKIIQSFLYYFFIKNIKKKYKYFYLVSGKSISTLIADLHHLEKVQISKTLIIIDSEFKNDFPFYYNLLSKKFKIILSDSLYNLIKFKFLLDPKVNISRDYAQTLIPKFLKKNQKRYKNRFKKLIYKKLNNRITKLKFKKKIIFFSYRTSYFKKDNFNSFRNSKLNKFNKGLLNLRKKNYTILRVGDYKKSNSTLFEDLIINDKFQRNILEATVARRCIFAICGISGVQTLPFYFNKPILLHNFIGFNKPPLIGKTLIIPKLLKYKSTNQIVPIKDILHNKLLSIHLDDYRSFFPIQNIDIGSFQSDNQYNKKGIAFFDNNQDEINAGILEIEKIFIKKQISKEHLELNFRFKKLFPKKYWIHNKDIHISCYWLKKYIDYFEKTNS